MRISLVICTKDRPEELAACLGSIQVQTVPPEEVVIVDAGRDDTARQIALSWQSEAGIRVKYLRATPGLAAQRNIGVENSTGEILGFLDDDLILDRRCLEAAKGLFLEDSGLGGIACVDETIPKIPWPKRLFWKIFMLPKFSAEGRLQRSGYPCFLARPVCRTEVECIPGAAFYTRRVFDSFRFDEKIPASGGMEDVDFSFRVGKHYRLIFDPSVRIFHKFSRNGRGYSENIAYMMVYYHHYFFRKHMDRSFLNIVCFLWSRVGEILRSICWAVSERSLRPFRGIFRAYLDILKTQRANRPL